jgi:hypothetical protein
MHHDELILQQSPPREALPLLTALTVLLVVMLFVIAPLQALGIFVFQAFELFFAIILVAGVFVMSGSRTAVAAMVVSLLMAMVGVISRINAPSILDINLFAGSWLIMGITLGFVVSRAVFAPGRVTQHHIMGAILLYLTIAITFVALFTFIGSLVPKAFSGLSLEDSPALASNLIYFSFVTLTTTGYGDIFPVHPIARSLCNLESIFGQLYPRDVARQASNARTCRSGMTIADRWLRTHRQSIVVCCGG